MLAVQGGRGIHGILGGVESILTGMDVSALQGALERRQMHPCCKDHNEHTFGFLDLADTQMNPYNLGLMPR
jgi:hypothetical protein